MIVVDTSALVAVLSGEPECDRVNAALDAWMRCGKGRHPAALNFGDCFAYALASLRGARLLFVGEDFARKDAAALG
jgi:ribonuclease VapC